MTEGKIKKELKNAKDGIRKGKTETNVSVPFSRFPMAKWEEWNEDCKISFNDVRWFKAYSDHLEVKKLRLENEQLKNSFRDIEQEKEEKDIPRNLHGDPL